jgi:hypothetical protein
VSLLYCKHGIFHLIHSKLLGSALATRAMVKMVKKIKILETKLEQFVGEGFAADDLKVVTKEIELDTSFISNKYSNNSQLSIKKISGDDSGQDNKEVLTLNKKILLLSSDGAGAEAMYQVKRIIEWMNKARYVSFDVMENLDGDTCDDEHDCTITGQTLAEALISFSLCLRHSFELLEDAYLLDTAVQKVIDSGLRTDGVIRPGMTLVSNEQMGTAVITELKLIEQGFCLE